MTMVVDYDSSPEDSILYTAALLYSHILESDIDRDDCLDYFLGHINKNIQLFYLSLDWLYLMGKISVSEEGIIHAIDQS